MYRNREEPKFEPKWREIPMANGLTVREFPESVNEGLRFQIGKTVHRMQRFPMFASRTEKTIIGWVDGGVAEVFKLLGWGRTFEAAEAMAKGR